jgi:hypothetical protein
LVLDEELEQLSSLVLVQGAAELVDGRRHLQSLKKDLLLSLKANILRPADETRKVSSLRSKITSDSSRTRASDEQRVRGSNLLTLGASLLGGRSSSLSGL